MKPLSRIVMLIGFIPFVLVGCGPVSALLSASPTGTANPVLFQDDFSDKSSGWSVLYTSDTLIGYDQGRFRFLLGRPGIRSWSTPRLYLEDVKMIVDATKLSGPDDNEYGLICRYQDDNNFYSLVISSNGYYGISKMKNGKPSPLGADGMQVSQAIRQGNDTNHLQAACQGAILTLWINDEKVLEVQDFDFAKGDVGLLAGAAETPGLDVTFDNFIVIKP